MTRNSPLDPFLKLKRGMSKGTKATHKPLLVLFALSERIRNGTQNFRYDAIEEPLRQLIRDPEFAGESTSTPSDPFWFLTKDRVWIVRSTIGSDITFSGDRPKPKELKDQKAQGQFSKEVCKELESNPSSAFVLIGRLVNKYFEHHQQQVLTAVRLWHR